MILTTEILHKALGRRTHIIQREMASRQYSSKKYKDWEVVEIKSKLKGKRKSRTLRVKSTSTAEEECRVHIEESLSASVESLTFEDIQSLRENADKANQTQATSKSSEQTPVGRLTTTQQTKVSWTDQ